MPGAPRFSTFRRLVQLWRRPRFPRRDSCRWPGAPLLRSRPLLRLPLAFADALSVHLVVDQLTWLPFLLCVSDPAPELMTSVRPGRVLKRFV